MVVQLSVLALAAGLSGACSAPPVEMALSPTSPANPDAPMLPFVRPVNVLVASGTPATSVPSTAMTMNHGSTGGMQMAQADSGQTSATGTVNSVDPTKRTVNISHDPIKALGWPSMRMDFPVAPSVDLNAVKPGSKISFTLGGAGADGARRVEQIKPAAGDRSQGNSMGNMPGMDHSTMPGMAHAPARPQ
jgi:Cu(I)/Ag(I) efflux system periplasmic protein CusF